MKKIYCLVLFFGSFNINGQIVFECPIDSIEESVELPVQSTIINEETLKKYINKEYVWTRHYYLNEISDLYSMETGKVLSDIREGSIWKCVGVDQKKGIFYLNPLVLVFQNEEYGKAYSFVKKEMGNDITSTERLILKSEASIGDKQAIKKLRALSLFLGKFLTLRQYSEEIEKNKKKNIDLVKKYGKHYASLIEDEEIEIGMTAQMCREALGAPNDINRTTTSGAVLEQWIYDNVYYYHYVYIKNGKVIGFQDTD